MTKTKTNLIAQTKTKNQTVVVRESVVDVVMLLSTRDVTFVRLAFFAVRLKPQKTAAQIAMFAAVAECPSTR